VVREYRAEEITDQHAKWFIEWIDKVYRDAMIHGYKHGWEDAKEHFSA
jgi:hypothetical protein